MRTQAKPRVPWIAGALTVLTIGVGHIYAGKPKNGIILFLLTFPLLWGADIINNLSGYSDLATFRMLLVTAVVLLAYWLCCIVNAVKIAKAAGSHYVLQSYNHWYIYLAMIVVEHILLAWTTT